MPDISYTPAFHHVDWIDNVDRIQAGGPNGFNIRLDTIQADLQRLSTVFSQVDTSLDALTTAAPPQTGQQMLAVGLATRERSDAPDAGWDMSPDGSIHPNFGDSIGLMDLALPDRARLVSMRVVGQFVAANLQTFTVTLIRVPLTANDGPSNQLAQISSTSPGITNPFDLPAPVAAEFAVVDVGTFRYTLVFESVHTTDLLAVAVHAVRIFYTLT
jgi:hypothetical protein